MANQSKKDSGNEISKEDWYVPESQNRYSNLPFISGMPQWEFLQTTCWGYKPPDFCRFDRLINYPNNLQEPQIGIQGTFGSGKSQLLNLIFMLKLAQGYKGIMFIDRHVEVRNIAPYKYYDDGEWHPFDITIWAPKNYEFYDVWKYLDGRENVHYQTENKGFQNTSQIIKKLKDKHHGVQAIYYDCYDKASRVRLWIDIMEQVQQLRNSKEQGYYPVIFAIHEFSEVMPMLPEGQTWTLAQEAADLFLDFRKDDIMTLVAYQMSSEVYYRFSFKWTFVLQKRPTLKRVMQAFEEPARLFHEEDVNIMRDGYWMHHKIGNIVELADAYRMIPQREKLFFGKVKTEDNLKEIRSRLYRAVIYMNEVLGLSISKIARELEIPRETVRDWVPRGKIIGGGDGEVGVNQ